MYVFECLYRNSLQLWRSSLQIPTTAQTPSSSAQGDAPAGYTATRTDGRDDGTDWGWLGLLGLTGLLGLIPKRRREEADYRATDIASRATAR